MQYFWGGVGRYLFKAPFNLLQVLALILLYQIISIKDVSSDSYTLLVLLFWLTGAILNLGIDVVSAAQVNYYVIISLYTNYIKLIHSSAYF